MFCLYNSPGANVCYFPGMLPSFRGFFGGYGGKRSGLCERKHLVKVDDDAA